MNNRLVTKDTPEVQTFFEELENLLNLISKRTLQEYRSTGKLAYYQLGGKILYKESDIKKLLESNRIEVFLE